MSEQKQTRPLLQVETENYKLRQQQRERAQTAAQLASQWVAAVRAGDLVFLKQHVLNGSPAALALELFEAALFRLDLRLDDPREAGKLAPFDLQIEAEAALLELAVLEPLPEGEGHWQRIFGSGLLLQAIADVPGWAVSDIVPINSDNVFKLDDPTDQKILAVHQGREALPLARTNLDPVEQAFLEQMQAQMGRFNIEELFNALRLWRDYKVGNDGIRAKDWQNRPATWAAAVEYLITLFDYFEVDNTELIRRYATTTPAIARRTQEIAQTLNVTQFDDRYSVHPNPLAYYHTLFKEIGIDFKRDEQVKAALAQSNIFDTIAPVPDDDADFFGPGR